VQEKLLMLKANLQEILKGTSPASEATRILSGVIDGLGQVIERQVDVLSRQLYPPTLSHGLVPTFLSFGDQFKAGPAVEIELDEELMRREKADLDWVPEQVKLAVYRIAEEALTNVVKHAKASKVTVRLNASGEGLLRLTVQDDGQGFDAQSASGGLGVATMQDYADAVGGQCAVHSTPGVGTEVTAVLPISRPVAGHPETSEKGGD
jgi:signal transduction histidine kinase